MSACSCWSRSRRPSVSLCRICSRGSAVLEAPWTARSCVLRRIWRRPWITSDAARTRLPALPAISRTSCKRMRSVRSRKSRARPKANASRMSFGRGEDSGKPTPSQKADRAAGEALARRRVQRLHKTALGSAARRAVRLRCFLQTPSGCARAHVNPCGRFELDMASGAASRGRQTRLKDGEWVRSALPTTAHGGVGPRMACDRKTTVPDKSLFPAGADRSADGLTAARNHRKCRCFIRIHDGAWSCVFSAVFVSSV